MRDTVFNGKVQCMVYKPDDVDFDTGLRIPGNVIGWLKGASGKKPMAAGHKGTMW